MGTPKNASKLAELARSRGWQVEVTHGRGAIVTSKAPEGFWPATSVAVRLRSPDDHIRAYGVWSQVGDKTKFDNGQVRSRDGEQQGVCGYRELRGLVERAGV